ncbi:MAG TPA: WXG100 family type VII secretion target [Pseudonocardiaceae bacterium]|nr:WXG100 family type VII secretion target [Pseudonocardiaceae bacterium]
MTSEGMQKAAGYFEQASSDITAQVTKVENALTALHANWTGTAATKFQSAMSDWFSQVKVIFTQLDSMITVMGANAQSYQATQDQAMSIATNLLPGL